ncbi:hypothetical protein BUV99_13065, partial [Corynebacterium diphtheriae]
RVISQPNAGEQFKIADDGFITHYHALTEQSVLSWLMASASIPGVMAAVNNIPDAPQGYCRLKPNTFFRVIRRLPCSPL